MQFDLHQVDGDKNTFLHVEVQKNCVEGMLALLQRGAHPNAVNKYGMTPLNYVVQKCNKNAIRLLLEHGADINFNPSTGTTALCVAINTEHPAPDLALVKFLLAQGADRYLADSKQKTPLAYAAMNGYTDIVNLLNGSRDTTLIFRLVRGLQKI
jgi:ankyrin repeat protein